MPRIVSSSLVAALLIALSTLTAKGDGMESGDFIAIVGDSITEQKMYSLYMEDYLLMCEPRLKLRVCQFGWGGETAPGFAARMENDLLRFEPSVITTCFGMNDGQYSPMQPAKARRYREAQQDIVHRAKKAGVRLLVIGSPGCVDSDTFRYMGANPQMYNRVLAEERDIARSVAEANGVRFADVYTPMIDVMRKAKAKYGKQYHLAGSDGIHPDRNGHLVMVYAFLKALGCSGEIGTISVDLASGKAEATDGHKVLACMHDQVSLESSRYPFCFYGKPEDPASTRGVVEFLPFNQDLNRLVLKVRGATGERCEIGWGEAHKEFTATQLAAGINLAAEFPDNPFSQAFHEVEEKILAKQKFETLLVKNVLHAVPEYRQLAPLEGKALDNVAISGMKHQRELARQVTEAIKPVRHWITIKSLGQ